MAKTSRAEIIAVARDLLRDKGYAGMSMQELATRVGLLKGSLYSHFASKEELVPEVLALTHAEAFGECAPSGDWRGDYTAMLEKMVAMLTANRRCLGLHLAYSLDGATPELAQAVRQFFLDLRALLESLLQQGLAADIAASLAVDTVTYIEGATLWLVIDDDDAPMQAAKKTLLARLAGYAENPPAADVRRILEQSAGDWRLASPAERRLAERAAEAENDALNVRAALEAASCFL
jgi:AcrR family transcriptional regulator